MQPAGVALPSLHTHTHTPHCHEDLEEEGPGWIPAVMITWPDLKGISWPDRD